MHDLKASSPAALHVWRHPKAIGAAGRCIGRTDLSVDPRKAKRLAHRLRNHARAHGLPRVVHTSALRRSADVGRWLARWGWRHHIEAALAESDFGDWDGLRWDEIGEAAVNAWCADFAGFRAHGGESLEALFERCAVWLERAPQPVCCIVGHAGWITAVQLIRLGRGAPQHAHEWPRPIAHAARLILG